MSLIGNIIWLIFGGLLTGLGYIIGGLGICLTIVGIPFGLQSIKLGFAVMTPFGRRIETSEEADSPLLLIFNLIWVIFFGWEIAAVHLASALLLAITIVGLPFAKQHLKLVSLALLPFGRSFR